MIKKNIWFNQIPKHKKYTKHFILINKTHVDFKYQHVNIKKKSLNDKH